MGHLARALVEDLGFIRSEVQPTLCTHTALLIFMAAHVDDLDVPAMCRDAEAVKFIGANSEYQQKMRDRKQKEAVRRVKRLHTKPEEDSIDSIHRSCCSVSLRMKRYGCQVWNKVWRPRFFCSAGHA